MPYSICQPEIDGGRGAILELWGRNLPDATCQRYDWLYARGPAMAWLLRSDEGDVVGAAGLMRRTVHVGGEMLRAAQAVDLNVDRSHRTVGPALRLQRTLAEAVDDDRFELVYGFPNAASEAVQRRIGYKVLGSFGRWAKPLRCEDGIKGWLRGPRMRKAASAVLDLLLRLRSPEAFYRRPAGVRVEVTDRFDARFDALWEKVSPQLGVAGERTSEYLDWRFRRSPAARHRVFCLCDSRRELRAYLVYSRPADTAYISDFLFGGIDDFGALLAEFIRVMRREKAEAIITAYLGPETVGRQLARFGFLRRPSSWNALVYFDWKDTARDPARLLDPQSWHLTRADVDTDF
jgi:hypothetical protein